jgi:two-component system, OmpR family, phosphate regulon response regulator PhoB
LLTAFNEEMCEISGSGTKPLVLVVEDHADTREMLRFVIEELGCRVIECADGEEAVRFVEELMPDLILMDTSLPIVDGLKATQRIRKLKSASKVTIIFLSGHAQPQSRAVAIAAGGDEYFVKPVNLGELELALVKYLKTTTLPIPAFSIA